MAVQGRLLGVWLSMEVVYLVAVCSGGSGDMNVPLSDTILLRLVFIACLMFALLHAVAECLLSLLTTDKFLVPVSVLLDSLAVSPLLRTLLCLLKIHGSRSLGIC